MPRAIVLPLLLPLYGRVLPVVVLLRELPGLGGAHALLPRATSAPRAPRLLWLLLLSGRVVVLC